jgi:Protein of unknown function (DUF4058)
MPNPFPGMNPYLENPELWPEVHHVLISLLAESLNPQLLPKYRAAIEKRVYRMSGEDCLLVGIPDVTVARAAKQNSQESRSSTNSDPSNVAVAAPPVTPLTVTVPLPVEYREGYIEVRETATKEVVTVIEVLSPKNKRSGIGRDKYQKKREAVLGSQTHWVEIDLLRAGEPMPFFGNNVRSDYRILLSRSNRRPRADLYAFNLGDRIPEFPLPLRSQDVEPIVDLQVLFDVVYDRAGYDFEIDYTKEPIPPLLEEDVDWVNVLLQEKGLH